jgi:hypothetical protein
MLTREKLISFMIFGLFVFSPLVPSWQHSGLYPWYGIYLYWLVIIVFCCAAQWRRHNQPGQD